MSSPADLGRLDRGATCHLTRVAPAQRVATVAFIEARDGRTDLCNRTERSDARALPFDFTRFEIP